MDLGVKLPPTVDESLRDKPSVHELMKMGMAAYLGPLRDEREQLEYVNFYAHLHRVVDEQLGRVMAALGRPLGPRLDPLADDGLPLRRSRRDGPLPRRPAPEGVQHLRGDDQHPARRLEPGPVPAGRRTRTRSSRWWTSCRRSRRSPGPASTARQGPRPDADPGAARRAGERAVCAAAGVDLGPITAHPSPGETVQDEIHFTYDDHQAATALQDVPGQPNRIRAVRTADAKFALYFDPAGKKPPEYEMYDLERDPEREPQPRRPRHGRGPEPARTPIRSELGQRLDRLMAVNGTAPG